MSAWPTVALVDVLEGHQVSYGIVQPGNDFSAGIPIVRVKDVRNGLIDTRSPMKVHPSISQNHSRTVLRGGELLMTLVGTVGEVAVAPSSLAGWNVARAIAVIRSDSVSSAWLKLCIESPVAKAQVGALLNTTVQWTLNLSDLKTIQIAMPPHRDRVAIAEVLGALDDKIAANVRLLETLDLLTSNVFQSMLGRSSEIPLSATAEFVNGKAFTKGASGTGRVVVRIAELNSGIGASTVYSDAEVEDKYVAFPGTLLFAWSGSLTMHRWFRVPAIINQHIFKVIPKDGYPMWLVHELLRGKLEFFKSTAADKATTMGHIQRRHLDELVSVPAQSEIDSHSVLMTSLWDLALAAECENESLAATRDALLPQFMSGKLRVRDGEENLEVAR